MTTLPIPDAPTLLLDAALGTELSRLGADTSAPLWSARALRSRPDLVLRVHRENAAAGADLLTAGTFRTHPRNLRASGLSFAVAEALASELTRRAIDLAREGGELGRQEAGEPGRPLLVAGSLSPLEDCYNPGLVPGDEALASEHRDQAERLAMAGADLIVVETFNARREALAAVRAALATGLPVVAAVVTDGQGRLLAGAPLVPTVRELLSAGPLLAVGVNCVPSRSVLGELLQLRDGLPEAPLAAWGNTGRAVDEAAGLFTEPVSPEEYARLATGWRRAGLRLVGGCCGTTAAHTRALRQMLDGPLKESP